MNFFTGLHMPNHAKYFERSFISINRLEKRRSGFEVNEWILDSGAFTRLLSGIGHLPVEVYAAHINRWASCGNLVAAVCQDYMCEGFILEATGLSVGDHQAMTIENYIALSEMGAGGVYIMPVLQGYEPAEYVEHIAAYGPALADGAWCGVGSVCKRNTDVSQIIAVLTAVKKARPDLKIHGFGLKQTALRHAAVERLLHSADSMAWSYAARKNGGDPNGWQEAKAFTEKINGQQMQGLLPS